MLVKVASVHTDQHQTQKVVRVEGKDTQVVGEETHTTIVLRPVVDADQTTDARITITGYELPTELQGITSGQILNLTLSEAEQPEVGSTKTT
jgi:hypothetical protein